MNVSTIAKEPGGKLLRLSARVEAGQILEIRMNGDFFAHPEEGFEAVEAAMAGCAVRDFARAFEDALGRNGVTLYGLRPAFAAASLELAIAAARESGGTPAGEPS